MFCSFCSKECHTSYKPIHIGGIDDCKCHETDLTYRYNLRGNANPTYLQIAISNEETNLCDLCYFVWYIKHDDCKKPDCLKSSNLLKLDDIIGEIDNKPILFKDLFSDNVHYSGKYTKLLMIYLFGPKDYINPKYKWINQLFYFHILIKWNADDWDDIFEQSLLTKSFAIN